MKIQNNNTKYTILELECNFSRLLLQEIQPHSFMAGHENPNYNITRANQMPCIQKTIQKHMKNLEVWHTQHCIRKSDWRQRSESLKMNWKFLEVNKNEKPGNECFSSWFHLKVVVWEALQKTSIFISRHAIENWKSWGTIKLPP